MNLLEWIAMKLARPSRKRDPRDDATRAEFESIFPDRCMYCSYTRWANNEQGQSLAIEPHPCKEGNSPAYPLPRAEVVK